MNTNTVQVVEKFGEKLDEYLGALANQAGVAAEHFYPIFVRQQTIEGFVGLVLILLFSIVVFVFLRMGFNNIVNFQNDNAAGIKCPLGFIGGVVLTIILLCILLNDGSTVVGKIVNPEYFAVKSLVEMVR